jgi:HAD superfamily hydrolase (TIGR01509 family)
MDGTLQSGEGAAEGFVAAVEDRLAEGLGFRPFPGTLNLSVADRSAVNALPSRLLADIGDDHCDGVRIRPCVVDGVRAGVLRPIVPDYPDEKVELVAPIRLRSLFGLDDGEPIPVSRPDNLWFSNGLIADPIELDRFDACVFDLDGTLVDLDVPWPYVYDRVEALLTDKLDESVTDYTRSEVMALARETGRYDELTALLEEHERAGAESAVRLSLLDAVADLDCPVGVCTANAESAARRALDRFGTLEAIDVIVARETVQEGKPDPRPLAHCLDVLGTSPGNAAFVGDERSDAETAAATGTSFFHSRQLSN